jgi:CRISPR-associated endonuclease/helicase Cas3
LLHLPEYRLITLPDDIDSLVQAVYEEHVPIPDEMQERLEKAFQESEGEDRAYRQEAHRAIIGLPDDASWDDPARFVLYDENDPFVHRTLAAQTRLGDESLTVTPLMPSDNFDTQVAPSFEQSKTWLLRALRIGRKGMVAQLKTLGIPESWQQSPLLRNNFPLCLDEDGRWLADPTVRLDAALGLTYDNET